MASRQTKADGITDALHEVRLEGVPRHHLQKQDHPLLAIPVVLGDTQAVLHLVKGFHCKSRKETASQETLYRPLCHVTCQRGGHQAPWAILQLTWTEGCPCEGICHTH